MTPLRIGTRGSALALAQAKQVETALKAAHPGLEVQTVPITTSGDRFSAAGKPPAAAADKVKGLFIKELEEALTGGAVDLAVHSAKDMESRFPAGLTLGAVLKRADPRDVLITGDGSGWEKLPAGALLGASSLRRQAQIRRRRRELQPVPIRGNVETRLAKLERGEVAGLILAGCGLVRLGLADRVAEWLPLEQFLPAPAQGAIALEIRSDDPKTAEKIAPLNDPDSWAEVAAERAMLAALGGSCRVPIAGLARAQGENLQFVAAVFSSNGMREIRESLSGAKKQPELLGRTMASRLRAAGADRLLFGGGNA
ncbi:MAG: hydroxymethylbilane synthase [Candidatus Omnitrophica bacterium CG11_big_fil_rev_8_21_14_0_20_64_10]|nr:MAG: hydroxymethylbilane synthase [Candidatus Omnitrophica bacterium CG11_big_fil_rev_8_21_14_0_20_64_10]